MEYSDISTKNIYANVSPNITYTDDKDFEDLIDEEYEYIKTDFEDFNMESQYIAPDFDLWESILNRKLVQKERKLIYDYLLEKDTNLQIKSLHNNMLSNGYFFIPKLTKNNGNCLWESLSHLGFGTASEIRKNIAALLLLVKNDWHFFPNRNTCPEELFINCNDIELVRDKNTGEVYEYDYNMMVMDLYSNHSWTRLPMELILMTICRVYEINIKIFSNKSDYINTISISINEEDNIFLGHINEEHYIPIIKIDNELLNDPILLDEFLKSYPKYISAKNKYENWAKSLFLFDDKDINLNINNNEELHTSKNIKIEEPTITNIDLNIDLEEIKDFNNFEIVE